VLDGFKGVLSSSPGCDLTPYVVKVIFSLYGEREPPDSGGGDSARGKVGPGSSVACRLK
jgi:hypothetical protein